MANLNFDTGMVVLNVQGDPKRKFSFNPTDHRVLGGFLNLIDSATKKTSEIVERAEAIDETLDESEYVKKTAELLDDIDKWFRTEFEKIFGEGSAHLVFEDMSTSSMNSDGEYIMVAMLMALYPFFEKEINARSEKIDAGYDEIMSALGTSEPDAEE